MSAKMQGLNDAGNDKVHRIVTSPPESAQLNCYHRLERERIRLALLDDVEQGLVDMAAGRTRNAREALDELRRSAKQVASASRGLGAL
jgi:hypothetical protein